jgi:hypothetical protein
VPAAAARRALQRRLSIDLTETKALSALIRIKLEFSFLNGNLMVTAGWVPISGE